MSVADLILIGNGGHAREVAWLSSEATERFRCVGYFDEAAPTSGDLNDLPFLGGIERAADYPQAHYAVAIGSPRVRARLVARLIEFGAMHFARIIHRSATLGRGTELAAGVQVCAGVRITTNVHIGQHSILNQNCTIAHDSTIGEFVTLAPLAAVSGNVTLHDGVEIGTGSALRQGITIQRGAMLGMGTVALRDVEENCLVVGNPARALRQLEPFG